MQRFDESKNAAARGCLALRLCLVPFLAIAVGLALTGCVERQLVFELAGDYGDVYLELDGHPIGKAPCTVYFNRYGVREWVARSDGHEIASGRIDLDEPWYQYPPMDLISEGIVPFKIVDRHQVEVSLAPLAPRDPDTLYARASAFRDAAERELAGARDRTPDALPKSRSPSRQE
jgi:hypothetical protein